LATLKNKTVSLYQKFRLNETQQSAWRVFTTHAYNDPISFLTAVKQKALEKIKPRTKVKIRKRILQL